MCLFHGWGRPYQPVRRNTEIMMGRRFRSETHFQSKFIRLQQLYDQNINNSGQQNPTFMIFFFATFQFQQNLIFTSNPRMAYSRYNRLAFTTSRKTFVPTVINITKRQTWVVVQCTMYIKLRSFVESPSAQLHDPFAELITGITSC